MVKESLYFEKSRKELLAWYFNHQRTLPWRATSPHFSNPYWVMLSEVMLQQTTVTTVIPYFQRFIEKFPTLKDLANANLDEVYCLWQGLGYYSRAKNLYLAAKAIDSLGYFPSCVKSLLTLPGFGPYTSAAIAAIAFDISIIPVDGNILRIASRLWAIDVEKGPNLTTIVQEKIQCFAHEKNNGDITQALMDLGATICRPKSPLCKSCPLHADCKAFQLNTVEKYPLKLPKKEIPTRVETTYIIFNKKEELLIYKRPSKGLFANLYLFPTTGLCDDFRFLNDINDISPLKGFIQHTFTHFHLHLNIKIGTINEDIEGLWVHKDNLTDYPFPKLMHKVIEKCKLKS